MTAPCAGSSSGAPTATATSRAAPTAAIAACASNSASQSTPSWLASAWLKAGDCRCALPDPTRMALSGSAPFFSRAVPSAAAAAAGEAAAAPAAGCMSFSTRRSSACAFTHAGISFGAVMMAAAARSFTVRRARRVRSARRPIRATTASTAHVIAESVPLPMPAAGSGAAAHGAVLQVVVPFTGPHGAPP